MNQSPPAFQPQRGILQQLYPDALDLPAYGGQLMASPKQRKSPPRNAAAGANNNAAFRNQLNALRGNIVQKNGGPANPRGGGKKNLKFVADSPRRAAAQAAKVKKNKKRAQKAEKTREKNKRLEREWPYNLQHRTKCVMDRGPNKGKEVYCRGTFQEVYEGWARRTKGGLFKPQILKKEKMVGRGADRHTEVRYVSKAKSLGVMKNPGMVAGMKLALSIGNKKGTDVKLLPKKKSAEYNALYGFGKSRFRDLEKAEARRIYPKGRKSSPRQSASAIQTGYFYAQQHPNRRQGYDQQQRKRQRKVQSDVFGDLGQLLGGLQIASASAQAPAPKRSNSRTPRPGQKRVTRSASRAAAKRPSPRRSKRLATRK